MSWYLLESVRRDRLFEQAHPSEKNVRAEPGDARSQGYKDLQCGRHYRDSKGNRCKAKTSHPAIAVHKVYARHACAALERFVHGQVVDCGGRMT